MNYCENNPGICKNGAKCISLLNDDGSYRCLCREGTSGRNCEHSEIHTVKPFITVKPEKPTNNTTDEPLTENVTDIDKFSFNNQSTTTAATTEKAEPAVSDNETWFFTYFSQLV